jgi:hypothetical protein
MKPSILAIALLVLRVPAFALTEGVAEFQGSAWAGGGKTVPGSGRVYLGKGAYRMEWQIDTKDAAPPKGGAGGAAPAGQKIVIIQKLSDPDHIVNIDDARKIYSITDLKEFREAAPQERRDTYRVLKQGRGTIAGFSCEKAAVISSAGTRWELCVSSELFPSSAFLALQSRRDRSDNLVKTLRASGLDAFPIRFVMRGKGSAPPVSTMELVRFEKKPVAPSLFEVPSGYTRASDTPATMAPDQSKPKKDAAPHVQKTPAKN